ncbi:MAG TPA: YceD family protein [Pseudomonadales bacterium]|nr:YceD family protein [Pseudomonadales bacterium]
MSTGALPNRADLRKLATHAAMVDARISLNTLPRVAQAVLSEEAEIDVDLKFSRDEQGLYVIEGSVSTTVDMTCQRCLQAVPVDLSSHFNLGVVWDDEGAKQLPSYLEPLVASAEPFDLHVLVEDELLLSLPFSPYHDIEVCQGGEYQQQQSAVEVVKDVPQRENPFAVLEQLKRKN